MSKKNKSKFLNFKNGSKITDLKTNKEDEVVIGKRYEPILESEPLDLIEQEDSNNESMNPNEAPNNDSQSLNNGISDPNNDTLLLNNEPFDSNKHKLPKHIAEKIQSELSLKKINQDFCDKWNKKLNSYAIFNFTILEKQKT